jgi:hypothetical protein
MLIIKKIYRKSKEEGGNLPFTRTALLIVAICMGIIRLGSLSVCTKSKP